MHLLFNKLSASTLTAPQRLLLTLFCSFCDCSGYCQLSHSQITKYSGLAYGTIVRAVKELTEKGWIKYKIGTPSNVMGYSYTVNLDRIYRDEEAATSINAD